MATLVSTGSLPADVGAALRTNLDLAVETAAFARHRLRPVRGPGLVAEGVIGDGQRVRWAARLFGVLPVRHTSEIAVLEDGAARARFVDTMVSGLFRSYAHEHVLTAQPGGGTLQEDTMTWTSPLGPLGRLADAVAVRAVMRHLLLARNAEVLRRLGG